MQPKIQKYSTGFLFCCCRNGRPMAEHFRFYLCLQIILDAIAVALGINTALKLTGVKYGFEEDLGVSQRMQILGWAIVVLNGLDIVFCCISRAQIGAYALGGNKPSEGILQLSVVLSSILNLLYFIGFAIGSTVLIIFGKAAWDYGNTHEGDSAASSQGLAVILFAIGGGMAIPALIYLSQLMQMCSICKGVGEFKHMSIRGRNYDYQ